MSETIHKKWEIILPQQHQQQKNEPYKKIKEQPEEILSEVDQIQLNMTKWEQKEKQIETYLQCILDSDYLLHMSQILKIFNIDIQNTQIRNKIKELSRVQYIEQQKIDIIFHFSTLKQFFKSFSQHTRKIHENIILLIERFYINNQRSFQVRKEKLRITILSNDNKILHIYSNISDSLDKFTKFLQNRFRRLKKIICIQVNMKQKVVQLSLLKNLHTICQNVTYMGFLSNQSNQALTSKKVTSEYSLNLGGVSLALTQYESFIFIRDKNKPGELQLKGLEKAVKLVKIQDLLMNVFTKNSPLSTRLFYQNQYCCSIFAFYFNLIKNYDQMQIKQQAVLQIQNQGINQIVKSLQRFDALKKKQKNNCKKCYPFLMDVSKKCWVCKKSKPKYICQGCSEDYDIKIYLCVDNCFKEFHKHKDKYLSKIEEHSNMAKYEAIQQEEVDKNILMFPTTENPPKTLEEYREQNRIIEQNLWNRRQQTLKDSQKIIDAFFVNLKNNKNSSLLQKGQYFLRMIGAKSSEQKIQKEQQYDSIEPQASESQLAVKQEQIVDNDSFVE